VPELERAVIAAKIAATGHAVALPSASRRCYNPLVQSSLPVGQNMQNAKCPTCGHEITPDSHCPACAQVKGNGKAVRLKPPPPPELAGRVFTPTPPEMAEEIRRTFDEAAFFAEVEAVLKTGGADIDALIARLSPRE
jgi:hypothetical protein